jgi:VanZ family protein
MKHILWFWLPPAGYMIAIFWVSSLPNPQIGGETPDYVLHALEYFLLALLLIRLFLTIPSRQESTAAHLSWRHACLLGMLVAIVYGVSDEIHQYFIPGRHCSAHDVLSDTFGSVLAYGAAIMDKRLLSRYTWWLEHIRCFPRLHTLSYAAYRNLKP